MSTGFKVRNCFYAGLLFPVVLLCGGCTTTASSDKNNTIPTDDGKVVALVQQLLNQESGLKESELIAFKGLKHGVSLHDYADTLALKLSEQYTPRGCVTVASFVNYDSTLQKTHALGNQFAEALKTSLSNTGYSIVDVNIADSIKVTSTGNFVLTREKKEEKFDFVVIGTLVHKETGLDINARVVEAGSKKMHAAAIITIPAYLFL